MNLRITPFFLKILTQLLKVLQGMNNKNKKKWELKTFLTK